jgi:hypothetical protein
MVPLQTAPSQTIWLNLEIWNMKFSHGVTESTEQVEKRALICRLCGLGASVANCRFYSSHFQRAECAFSLLSIVIILGRNRVPS